MTEDEWTIEELAERVADALAAGYPGPASRRVREVPDRRTIRWYTTIGLVDRPAAMRGRTALYHRRHLLQLVAVKRLQAEGRSLASIQESLLGAGDEALERIAKLAPDALAAAAKRRVPKGSLEAGASRRPPDGSLEAAGTRRPPADSMEAGNRRSSAEASRARFWTTYAASPTAEPPSATEPSSLAPPAALVPAVQLDDGVTLLLGNARTPTPDELAAVQLAAGPLIDLLRRLDLTRGPTS